MSNIPPYEALPRGWYASLGADQLEDGTYLKHQVIADINKDVQENGTPWQKCANCGDPYSSGRSTLCSDECEAEFLSYLNSDEGRSG